MQRLMSLVYTLCCLIFIPISVGKTFSSWELSQELVRQGFPEYQLSDWICLIEAESSRRTEVIGGPNADGSFDYGLFQINNRYWCGDGYAGKACNVACQNLLSDDIREASECAKKIHQIHGFDAWVGWRNKCRK